MKTHALIASILVTYSFASSVAVAQNVLSGDTRLACEAVLCLASGNRPEECSPSLHRYFSIQKRKLSDTINARASFLKLCPSSSQTPQMDSLVEAESRSAGTCDAQSLNAALSTRSGPDDGKTRIDNHMPPHCVAYFEHEYTAFRGDGTMPRYVGTPETGGFWVESSDFDRAAAEYELRKIE